MVAFINTFLSYLLVLGLAVLFSIGIYFHFHNIINRQSEEITITLLDKMQAEIDARFRGARLNLVNLILDSEVQKAAAIRGGFSIRDRELLYHIYSDIGKKNVANDDISHIFIYFKDGKTILSEQGHMESSLFYELYYEQPGSSLEDFQATLEKGWSGEELAVRNKNGEQEIWVLQDLFARNADSAATLGVSISESALNRWMRKILWNESMELMMIQQIVHQSAFFPWYPSCRKKRDLQPCYRDAEYVLCRRRKLRKNISSLLLFFLSCMYLLPDAGILSD